MELLQVGGGSVFKHAITLERGLTIMKSLCHLPTRHIALFQYGQLLCPPHPHPKCVVLPGGPLHQPGGVSEVLQSSTSLAMGGCDFVGFNHIRVKLKFVLFSHTPTCLVFAQGFYTGTLPSQLGAGPAARKGPPMVSGITPAYCQGRPVPLTQLY